jgi:hypothetical protein
MLMNRKGRQNPEDVRAGWHLFPSNDTNVMVG